MDIVLSSIGVGVQAGGWQERRQQLVGVAAAVQLVEDHELEGGWGHDEDTNVTGVTSCVDGVQLDRTAAGRSGAGGSSECGSMAARWEEGVGRTESSSEHSGNITGLPRVCARTARRPRKAGGGVQWQRWVGEEQPLGLATTLGKVSRSHVGPRLRPSSTLGDKARRWVEVAAPFLYRRGRREEVVRGEVGVRGYL